MRLCRSKLNLLCFWKVVDCHIFFQNKNDLSSTVLKKSSNRSIEWMHKPTKQEVEKFETIIPGYQRAAKKVRVQLIDDWITEELESFEDPVVTLNNLRTSGRDGDVWPCYKCPSLGQS